MSKKPYIPGQIPMEVPESDVMRHADRALKTLQSFYESAENMGLVFGGFDDTSSCCSSKELSVWYLKPILTLSMYNKYMNECSVLRKAGCRIGIRNWCDEKSKSVINQLEKNGVKTLYLFYHWIEGDFLHNYGIDRESMAHLNKVKIWLDKGGFEPSQDDTKTADGGHTAA